jgi:flagellar motor switch protein FliM
MSSESYDFRRPGRLAGDVQQLFAQWQRAISSVWGMRWSEHLPAPIEPRADGVELVRRDELLARDGERQVTYRVDVANSSCATVVQMSSRALLGMVSGMLGEPIEELPEHRGLTDIEKTLIDLLISEFVVALNSSQTGAQALEFVDGGRQRIKDLRHEFPDAEEAVALKFIFETSFGPQSLTWVLSGATVSAILDRMHPPGSHAEQVTSPDLLENVQAIPVQLVVRLGLARVQVAELADMRVGDVLLLNQRLTEPLQAEVSGKVTFVGWPGRVGNRQAFQISGVED